MTKNATKKVGRPIGSIPWNKGKKLHYSVWNKDKTGLQTGYWKGKKFSKEHREKLSLHKKGKPFPCVGGTNTGRTRFKKGLIPWNKGLVGYHAGEKSHFWKGGITPVNAIIRSSLEYKLWREAVFKRDNWKCQECGIRSGKGVKVVLHAHHIKPFYLFPELRTAIDNGITLCENCHAIIDPFRARFSHHLQRNHA